MKTQTTRIFVYPADIRLITGKGERYCRSCYRNIMKHYGKAAHHLITVQELAHYYGITTEELQKILR